MSGIGASLAASLPPSVRALAGGDLTALAAPFAQAGCAVTLPAAGMLQVRRGGTSSGARPAVLVSVGVHGDETAPIELLAQALEALGREPELLAVDLMVVVGNLEAVNAGKRFIEADLNRLFRAERGDLAGVFETARADAIMQHTRAFFDGAGPVRWHLDLHTAIRPSHYPMFAIVPDLIAERPRRALGDWLAHAGIGAIIRNARPSGTYSYFTAGQCAAAGATVELGQVGVLGSNDLGRFAATRGALDALLRGQALSGAATPARQFAIAQEIIKRSADFALAFDRRTENFTAMAQGALIATDGALTHTVQAAHEYVVFPNPDVRIGQRAALMVVPCA